MIRLLAAIALLCVIATTAAADKVVTYKTLTLAEVTGVVIERRSGATVAHMHYSVKDAGGAVVKLGAVAVTLNAGQTTTVENFVTNVMLPAANTQEGL